MEKAVLVEFSVDLLITSSVLQPNAHYFLHIFFFSKSLLHVSVCVIHHLQG
jgi:hypothetical protein